MERGFLSASTVARIKTKLRPRGFQTRLDLSDPHVVIVIDRDGVARPPQEVIVKWAQVQPVRGFTPATDTALYEGTIRRWESLDAQLGDRFMLHGQVAEVTQPVRVVNGVAMATFTWTTGQR
jgi:hypothetical protein